MNLTPFGQQTFCCPNDTAANRRSHEMAPNARSGMTQMAASELTKLSSAEREVVYDDIHAVSRPREENSLEINKLILNLKEDLASIRVKTAYNKALFLNPEYVHGQSFLVMFLRSTNFDTKKAAQTIVNHFRNKLDLFGPDVLGRDIKYEDLDDDTKQAMGTGAYQTPPVKDAGGRAVFFHAFDHMQYKSVENQLRVTWYMTMCALKDPETQKNGAVQISYNVGYSSKTLHLDLVLKSTVIETSMPCRILGLHFCYDSDMLHPLLSTLQLIVGYSTRLRIRSHHGSHLEVMYALRSFGIPQAALPLDSNGSLISSRISEYIQERITLEDQQEQALDGRIIHPLSTDVLLGRGWHQQEHPGNLKLARIVDEHRVSYKAARKRDKIKLNWHIVEIIRESGGRFLERSQETGGGWVEAGEASARDKVSKCFRTKTRQSHEIPGAERDSEDTIMNDASMNEASLNDASMNDASLSSASSSAGLPSSQWGQWGHR
eukprot:scaffold758_cov104-Cylindrotheca_fusiformis.AAC.3